MIEVDLFVNILDTLCCKECDDFLAPLPMTIESVKTRLIDAGFPSDDDAIITNIATDMLVTAHLKHSIGVLSVTEMPTMTVLFRKIFANPSLVLECSESSMNDSIAYFKSNVLTYL